MDLENIRANGVSAIEASCYCDHSAHVDVSWLKGVKKSACEENRWRGGQIVTTVVGG